MSASNASLFGEFLIVCRAEDHGGSWSAFYKINQFADDGKTSQVFEDEEQLEGAFESEEQAIAAAKAAAESKISRGKPPKWS
jgi:hypothetical protein